VKLINYFRIFLYLIVPFGVISTAFSVSAEQPLIIDQRLFDTDQANRILLVTYADKYINRIPIGTGNQAYRRRGGQYSSTTWSRRVAADLEQDYRLKILSQWPIKEIGEHCVVYLVGKDLVIEDVVQSLSNDRRIDHVQSMNTFEVMANSYNDPYYRLQTNIHSINLAKIHRRTTGKNIAIAIVDTGVDTKHPDLKGQIQHVKDFVTQKPKDFRSDLHGTAVAGVIAAKPNNQHGIVGIAPDSNVIALKACWGVRSGEIEGVCNSFTLALAINTAIEMKVDILNLSLTGPYDSLLARLIDKAVRQGIIVIASQSYKLDSQSGFPAQQQGVIGVRSTGTGDHLMRSSYREDYQTVLAPGDEILTTLPKGTYDFVSGNSLATAHISGLAALLLEYERGLTGDELFGLLEKVNEPTFYKIFGKYGLKTVRNESSWEKAARRISIN